MAVTAPPPRSTSDVKAQALFDEARRRRRHRRVLLVVVVAVAVLASAGTVVLTGGDGHGSGSSPVVPGQGRSGDTAGHQTSVDGRPVTSLPLPAHYWFNQVTMSGTHLLLTGTVASTSPSAPCVAAPVDPRTLVVGKVVQGSCGDPALFGRTVIPVISYPRDAADGTVAVALRDPSTGVVTTSAVVMTFPIGSDTRPVTTYGGGWLWIYDVDTTNGAEALEVSATSGRIAATVSTPPLVRPIIAANDDGLWLGNSIEGSDGSTASSPLWHAGPGATSAVAVGPTGSQHVVWLVGSGDHLWAGIGPFPTDQTIWRFDGPTGQVGLETRERGYDPTSVVGNATDGLWTLVPYPPLGAHPSAGDNTRQDVVSISPSSGRETVVGDVKPVPTLEAEEGMSDGQAAVVDGSYVVLQPPFRTDGYLGYEYLVRAHLS